MKAAIKQKGNITINLAVHLCMQDYLHLSDGTYLQILSISNINITHLHAQHERYHTAHVTQEGGWENIVSLSTLFQPLRSIEVLT